MIKRVLIAFIIAFILMCFYTRNSSDFRVNAGKNSSVELAVKKHQVGILALDCIDIFASLNGSPDIGGSWSVLSGTPSGYSIPNTCFDSDIDTCGVYILKYLVENTNCTPPCRDSSLLTINYTKCADPCDDFTASITGDLEFCSGLDAELTANGSGGLMPYAYMWNNSMSSQVITVDSGGTYMVTVTDSNGCTATDEVTVIENPAPVLACGTIVNETDCDNPNGSIQVTVTSGTPPYSYTDGTTTNSTGFFDNLTAGSYAITVTDDNGCTDEVSCEVLEDCTPCTPEIEAVFDSNTYPIVNCSTLDPNEFSIVIGGTLECTEDCDCASPTFPNNWTLTRYINGVQIQQLNIPTTLFCGINQSASFSFNCNTNPANIGDVLEVRYEATGVEFCGDVIDMDVSFSYTVTGEDIDECCGGCTPYVVYSSQAANDQIQCVSSTNSISVGFEFSVNCNLCGCDPSFVLYPPSYTREFYLNNVLQQTVTQGYFGFMQCGGGTTFSRSFNCDDLSVGDEIRLEVFANGTIDICGDVVPAPTLTRTYIITQADLDNCCGGCTPCTPNLDLTGGTIGCNNALTFDQVPSCSNGVLYTWDIDLGTTQVASGTGVPINYTPTQDGTYTVTLNFGTCGNTVQDTYTFDITDCNPCTPCVAAITNPIMPTCNTSHTFLAPSCTGAIYTWQMFLDGNNVQSANNIPLASGGDQFPYVFQSNGNYILQLSILDECGTTTTASWSGSVSDCPCNCTLMSVLADVDNCELDITYQGEDCGEYEILVNKHSSTNGTCTGGVCTYPVINIPSSTAPNTILFDPTSNAFCDGQFGQVQDYQVTLRPKTNGACTSASNQSECVNLSCCPCTSEPTIDFTGTPFNLIIGECFEYLVSDVGCTSGNPPETYTLNYTSSCPVTVTATAIYAFGNCSGIASFNISVGTSSFTLTEVCGNLLPFGICGPRSACATTWEIEISNCFGSNTYIVAFA